ncbi:hypothetical protein ACN42_g7281 [Penicillium freii]|uniref:Uncharacterized protein n=1 Tax=Penicillium freii TaxID=48697 RepID=A0A101MFX6_PENFR|nr:hypothetical protein ACN42_g7281 [Penicillium freii]
MIPLLVVLLVPGIPSRPLMRPCHDFLLVFYILLLDVYKGPGQKSWCYNLPWTGELQTRRKGPLYLSVISECYAQIDQAPTYIVRDMTKYQVD